MLELIKVEVGPWPMNSYLVAGQETRYTIIVDPGADPETILSNAESYDVKFIFITHGHPDHIGALNEVRQRIEAKVIAHQLEVERFGFDADIIVGKELVINLGSHQLEVIHIPGHTAGHCAFS